jgi:hypothetical protein
MERAFFCKVNAFSAGAAQLKSDGLRFIFARLHRAALLHQICCHVTTHEAPNFSFSTPLPPPHS